MSSDIRLLSGSRLDYIGERPEMYLPAGGLTLSEKLGTLLVMDALALGAGNINLSRVGEWSLVSAEIDWLRIDGLDNPLSLFERVVAFPRAGVNSIRHEVVVTAFSLDVLTYAGSDVFVIRDSGASADVSALRALWDRQEAARGIAFRCGAN